MTYSPVPYTFANQVGPLAQLDSNFSYVSGKVVSLVDYGADPTGTAPSDAALTAFFAAVAGGEGVIPPGTYKYSTSMTIAGNTTIRWLGGATLKFTGTGSA